jgi:hypothetical protein
VRRWISRRGGGSLPIKGRWSVDKLVRRDLVGACGRRPKLIAAQDARSRLTLVPVPGCCTDGAHDSGAAGCRRSHGCLGLVGWAGRGWGRSLRQLTIARRCADSPI